MGYPQSFKPVSSKIEDNIVITSGPFAIKDKLNVGSRMALFKYGTDIIVWSALPYGEQVIEALKLLSDEPNPNVTHLIIPNNQHIMAAESFKVQFPNLKILSTEQVDLGENVSVDYKFTNEYGNKVLQSKELQEIGIKEDSILNNFEFVYLSTHKNRELMVYEKKSKTLFGADLIFNVDYDGKSEQYCEKTGYAPDHYQHAGWSFITRYLNPDSRIGIYLMNRVSVSALPSSKEGLKAVYSLNFDRIVMCHGNIITQDAKEAFYKVFKDSL
ncbi:hypothetical protein CAAN1_11S02520 [[Candida] anglica]|uniref:Metallo-beta-lactamase domain-containing protein n=1 Tax=[Candida] anglica TaxID=148631 RepID=A0ABP0EMC1_9ASCO